MKVYYFVILVCAFLAGSASAANPQVTLHVTGGVTGDIVLELYPDDAPVTVENFINYVQTGFYDGLIFHRVIKGFMVQGGGFNTDVNLVPAGPEIINESSNRLPNLRGTLSMARISYADSASSQFFINLKDNTHLNYGTLTRDHYNFDSIIALVGYCVFAEVVSGMDVVDAIALVDVVNAVPVNNVKIESAEITLNVPVCVIKLPGDIDGDCDVDLADFAKLAENWLACNAINGCQ
jgi:cyclophilin family peptidyl-prolyl cis-trans isomerase